MLLDHLLAAGLGPIEVPVALTVGDPAAGATPERVGTVHLALRADGVDDHGVRLVPVDPDDLRHQLAELLDRYTAGLRASHNEEGVPGAAPRR